MAESEVRIVHNVVIEAFGPDGRLKDRRENHNLVVTAGKNAIATLLKEGTTRPKFIAVGTGTEEPAAGDTKLKTEKVRKEATITVESAKVKFEKEFAAEKPKVRSPRRASSRPRAKARSTRTRNSQRSISGPKIRSRSRIR